MFRDDFRDTSGRNSRELQFVILVILRVVISVILVVIPVILRVITLVILRVVILVILRVIIFPLVFAFQRCFCAVCRARATDTRSNLADFVRPICLIYFDFSLEMSGNTIGKASKFSRIIKNTVDQLERKLVSTSSTIPHLHGQVVHDGIRMETNN